MLLSQDECHLTILKRSTDRKVISILNNWPKIEVPHTAWMAIAPLVYNELSGRNVDPVTPAKFCRNDTNGHPALTKLTLKYCTNVNTCIKYWHNSHSGLWEEWAKLEQDKVHTKHRAGLTSVNPLHPKSATYLSFGNHGYFSTAKIPLPPKSTLPL